MAVRERRFQPTLNEWVVVGIVLVSLATLAIAWYWAKVGSRERLENDRAAYQALEYIDQAELDFWANDRDQNGIQDFWTGDVAGLNSIKANGQPIAILSRAIAEADIAPLLPLASKPIPYHGYYFMSLEADERSVPPEPYRQDTDRKSGKVHNLRAYAICAFPSGTEAGNHVWILEAGGTIFRTRKGMITPPKNRPTYTELAENWEPQSSCPPHAPPLFGGK